jgi:hypothetical protein
MLTVKGGAACTSAVQPVSSNFNLDLIWTSPNKRCIKTGLVNTVLSLCNKGLRTLVWNLKFISAMVIDDCN